MKTNRNIVDMVEAIRGGIADGDSRNVHTYIAEVLSVEPLTIKMHDTSITKNIYLNPALMVGTSNSEEKMQKVFQDPFETQEAYQFLKEFHEKFVLKVGDTVVVHVTGSSFYIAGKAARA